MVYYFVVGVATALDTKTSQAFGRRDQRALNKWTKVGFIVMGGFGIVLSLALLVASSVIRVLFQQPQDIADQAGLFCQLMIPGVWGLLFYMVC